MKIIVVFNQKGGVGKTSTVTNMMAELTKRGKKVLALDLDAQANLTSFCKIIAPKYTIKDVLSKTVSIDSAIQSTVYGDVVPSDETLGFELLRFASDPSFVLRVRTILEGLSQDRYNFVLIDCPPAVNQVTASALVSANYVLIPTEMEYFSAVGVGRIAETIEQIKPFNTAIRVIGVLIVKYNARRTLTKILEGKMMESTRELLGCDVLSAKIHFTVDIPSAQASGLSVYDYNGKSKATVDYCDLIDELLEKIKTQEGVKYHGKQ